MEKICCICKNKRECYSTNINNEICLNCIIQYDWFYFLSRSDKKKIKNLLKQRKKEREDVKLEDKITEIKDRYDSYYADIENVKRIKEKERYCKFCNKRKITRYKIDETNAICNSCLGFIAGMDNQARWGRNPPPKNTI